MEEKPLKTRLAELVNLVPHGRVVYYGQLARLLGVTAQMVGWQLSGMKREEWKTLPWWRVVAKNGNISTLKLGEKGILQLDLLTQEGIDVTSEQVDMIKHGFDIEELMKKEALL